MTKKRTTLNTAPEPPETIHEWLDVQNDEFIEYGKFFPNRQEFEYFVMLPLSKKQRYELLQTMLKEQAQQEEPVDSKI